MIITDTMFDVSLLDVLLLEDCIMLAPGHEHFVVHTVCTNAD
jgi:hypothetical protein